MTNHRLTLPFLSRVVSIMLLLPGCYFGKMPTLQAQTQNLPIAPQESYPGVTDPYTQAIEEYNRQMQMGYAAAQAKEYGAAKQAFEAALQIRPNDIYARQALFNIDTYQVLNQQKPPTMPLLWLFLGTLTLVILLCGLFFFLFHQSQQHFLREVFERRQQFDVLQNSLREGLFPTTPPPALAPQTGVTPAIAPEPSPQLPPAEDRIAVLIQELKANEPQQRRPVIGELANIGDSRAIKPLVDLMHRSNSQERSVILEALSQISTRTLQPMNQALTLSLQDPNPQVRQNAIQDLTHLYELMSQISQQLALAVTEQEGKSQETPQKTLNPLNLSHQTPASLHFLNFQTPRSGNQKT
jgi:hypothetical protein